MKCGRGLTNWVWLPCALTTDTGILWLQDRKGRTVGIPSAKIAWIEISPLEERRVGFAVP